VPEGHPDRRVREELHPRKQGRRPDPDLAPPPDAEHQIEQVGGKLRAMMPWIAKNKLVDQSKN
jgi:ketol-acid reductoisomerase